VGLPLQVGLLKRYQGLLVLVAVLVVWLQQIRLSPVRMHCTRHRHDRTLTRQALLVRCSASAACGQLLG
jgi:hypothetical protein